MNLFVLSWRRCYGGKILLDRSRTGEFAGRVVEPGGGDNTECRVTDGEQTKL